MKMLICELCGSGDMIKKDGYYVCQACETKYSVEEAKKLMIEGPVDVSGSTVAIDNSAYVRKYLENARRAKKKEDWEEVEKYYNMVEQNDPHNIEALFFSAYAKLRLTIMDDYGKWEQAYRVLGNSISVLDDYFDIDNEERDRKVISEALNELIKLKSPKQNNIIVSKKTPDALGPAYIDVSVRTNKLNSQVSETIDNIIKKYEKEGKDYDYLNDFKNNFSSAGGCYIATCVYGSYDCPQVWTLRRYRDNILSKTWYGRAFIHTYYAVSPTIVRLFGNKKWFKEIWKGKLDRMVFDLNSQGIKSTEYQDKNW